METDPLNMTSDSERALNMAEVKREAEGMLEFSDAEDGEITLLDQGQPGVVASLSEPGAGASQTLVGAGHPGAGSGMMGAGSPGDGANQPEAGGGHSGERAGSTGSGSGLTGTGNLGSGSGHSGSGTYHSGARYLEIGARHIGAGVGPTSLRGGTRAGIPGVGARAGAWHSGEVAGAGTSGVGVGHLGAGSGAWQSGYPHAGARIPVAGASQQQVGIEPPGLGQGVGVGLPGVGVGHQGAGSGLVTYGTGLPGADGLGGTEAAWLGVRPWRGQRGARTVHHGPRNMRGQGWSRGQARCRPHRRRACRACSAPLHIRVNTILSEIAEKIEELDGRRPTTSQIRNMINNTSF